MYGFIDGKLQRLSLYRGNIFLCSISDRISAAILLYLGYGFKTMKAAINPHLMHKGEAFGAIAYIALASIGLIAGGNFVRNAIWNNGDPGKVISAGTITYMSWAVGFKVLTGVAFLLMLLISLLGDNQDEM